jgi:hypothetical protein
VSLPIEDVPSALGWFDLQSILLTEAMLGSQFLGNVFRFVRLNWRIGIHGFFRIPRRRQSGIVSTGDDVVGLWATLSYQSAT